MKQYVNNSNEMKTLVFKDGSTVFMFRGQKVESDKELKREVPKGVRVKDVGQKRTRSTKKKEDVDQTTEESNTDDADSTD